MFSGIVERIGTVARVHDTPGGRAASIRTPAGWRFGDGESVSVEGVCSTVQRRSARMFRVVYMHETLQRTTLGSLVPGSPVNLERSLRLDGLVGGHLVQGHVDTTARILGVRADGDAKIYRFGMPARYMRYIVEKGSIAVDGISLTVVDASARAFTVSLLAYTLEHTTLGGKGPGGLVNIEVDLMAKYAERLLRR